MEELIKEKYIYILWSSNFTSGYIKDTYENTAYNKPKVKKLLIDYEE